MKKLITLIFICVFASTMAFAQNSSTVTQSGDNNDATVDQTYNSGLSSDINEASVNQIGDDNTVERLNQLGAGNLFTVTQDGDNNLVKSHPKQGGQGGIASFDGTIDIQQNNDGNRVWDADQAGYGNEAYITQDGNDDANIDAQVSIEGSGNTITIDQMSGSNAVGVFSHNGPGAYQEGSGNTMDITQSGGAEAGTESKMVGATEDFFRGSIEGGQGLVQFGLDNEMYIDQDGASTVEFIVQDGDLNEANVMQTGNNHTADVWQSGDSNTANITQN